MALSKPFDKPFDKLTVLSEVEGLTVLSEVEGLTVLSEVEGLTVLSTVEGLMAYCITPVNSEAPRPQGGASWARSGEQNASQGNIIFDCAP